MHVYGFKFLQFDGLSSFGSCWALVLDSVWWLEGSHFVGSHVSRVCPHHVQCNRYYRTRLQAAACGTRTHQGAAQESWDVQDQMISPNVSGCIGGYHRYHMPVYTCLLIHKHTHPVGHMCTWSLRDHGGTPSFLGQSLSWSTCRHSSCEFGVGKGWFGATWPGSTRAFRHVPNAGVLHFVHKAILCMHAWHQFIQVSANSCDVSSSHARGPIALLAQLHFHPVS